MACVYRHIRTDLNIPFYIGIGKEVARAYCKVNRNQHWKNIVGKTSYDVHILFDDVSYEFAKEKEKEFIELYKRKEDGGILCKGKKHSEETKKKMSESKIGKGLGVKASEETRKKMSESAIKGEGHQFSKLKQSDVLEIRRLSSEGMSQRKIGKKFNVTKTAISHILKGLTWKHV